MSRPTVRNVTTEDHSSPDQRSDIPADGIPATKRHLSPEETAKVVGFATGLSLLKAKNELGEGATLTADEVDGIIWGIKQLRGGRDRRDPTNPA